MTGTLKYSLRQSFVIETGDDPNQTALEKVAQDRQNNRKDAADLWLIADQEECYKAAETLFSGDVSVESLFAWETANRNGKSIASFHDEKRADALGKSLP
jgi:hypothetical protein